LLHGKTLVALQRTGAIVDARKILADADRKYFIDRLVSFVVFTLNPFHIGNLREIVGAFGVRSGYNHLLEEWLARPA
jgi:Na+-translocating ferredoxin:NAD+ oxidoreductase RnfE subunit